MTPTDEHRASVAAYWAAVRAKAPAPCPKAKDGRHKWGTDGYHLNVFCTLCFVSRPPDPDPETESHR